MKKLSGSFDKDTIKNFFIQHGEKVGFGVAVVLIGVFFYVGFGKDVLTTEIDPSQLDKKARSVQDQINNASWDEYVEHRTVNRAPDTSDKMIRSDFLARKLGEAPPPRRDPRLDPELKPPTDLQVIGEQISLALTRRDERVNNIDLLAYHKEDAPRRSRNDDDDDGSSSAFSDYGGGDDEGPGFSGDGAGPGGAPGGAPGGGPGASGAPADAESIPDVMLRELEGVAGIPTFAGSQTRMIGLHCIAVTAVVPYEIQWLEYENKFQSSIGYSPSRDYPEYVYLEVQRRTDGGEWVDLSDRVQQYQQHYVIVTPDICDPLFTDPRLTLPVPPVLVGQLDELSLHPKVDRISFDEAVEAVESSSDTSASDDIFGGNNAATSDRPSEPRGDSGRGNDSGYPGGDGGYPGGGPGGDYGGSQDDYGDEYGYGGGNPYGGGGQDGGNPYGGGGDEYGSFAAAGPDRDDVDVKLIRFYDMSGEEGKTYEYRVRVWLVDVNNPEAFGGSLTGGYGGTGGGDDEGPGAGGAGAGGSGAPGGAPGGGYGGGNQTGEVSAVTMTMLEPSVRNRVKDWKNSEEYAALPENDPRRTARATEWSDVSTPYTIPSVSSHYYAGPIGERTTQEAEGVQFSSAEIAANVAVNVWDPSLAMFVPGSREFYRGDKIDFVADKVKVMNPLDLTLRTAGVRQSQVDDEDADPDMSYRIASQAIVVDISGGDVLPDSLPANLKMEFFSPSEVLLFDENGGFTVLDEFEDIVGYRHSLFLADDEISTGRRRNRDDDDDASSPFGGGGYPGGGQNDGGYPGGGQNDGGYPGGSPF